MRPPQLSGAGGGAHRAPSPSSSRLCKHIPHDDNIQQLSPSGLFLMGPPFSVRIPASSQTFLVNLRPPESACCSLTSLGGGPPFQGVQSKSRQKQVASRRPGGLLEATGQLHSGKRASWGFSLGVSSKCGRERSELKGRTLAGLQTWGQKKGLAGILETRDFSTVSLACPPLSRNIGTFSQPRANPGTPSTSLTGGTGAKHPRSRTRQMLCAVNPRQGVDRKLYSGGPRVSFPGF